MREDCADFTADGMKFSFPDFLIFFYFRPTKKAREKYAIQGINEA